MENPGVIMVVIKIPPPLLQDAINVSPEATATVSIALAIWLKPFYLRGQHMVIDNRTPGDYGHCEYHRLAHAKRVDTPVRIIFDHKGREIGADTVDPKTGSLVENHILSTKVFWDPDCNEFGSTEEEFWALCEARVAEYKKKKEP